MAERKDGSGPVTLDRSRAPSQSKPHKPHKMKTYPSPQVKTASSERWCLGRIFDRACPELRKASLDEGLTYCITSTSVQIGVIIEHRSVLLACLFRIVATKWAAASLCTPFSTVRAQAKVEAKNFDISSIGNVT